MPYDLYLFTKLFAVRDKWNANVPYVANVKINNAAKGTETYADSVIHVITEETHRFMKKKKSKTHVVLNNCSQGGGRFLEACIKYKAGYLVLLIIAQRNDPLLIDIS